MPADEQVHIFVFHCFGYVRVGKARGQARQPFSALGQGVLIVGGKQPKRLGSKGGAQQIQQLLLGLLTEHLVEQAVQVMPPGKHGCNGFQLGLGHGWASLSFDAII